MELTIKDVVELAKAGYKPKDVRELIEASKAETKPAVETEPTTEVITENKSDITVTPESDKSPEPMPKESEKPEDTVDYKAMYEAEKQRVDSLQNKLNRQDISKETSPEEVDLLALVKEFC